MQMYGKFPYVQFFSGIFFVKARLYRLNCIVLQDYLPLNPLKGTWRVKDHSYLRFFQKLKSPLGDLGVEILFLMLCKKIKTVIC